MTRWLVVGGLVLAALGCGGNTERSSEPRYLAFIADSETLERFDLHVVNAADAELGIRVLASSVSVASWSPDGRWLAFSNDGVFVADSEQDFALEQLAENPSQVRWSATSRWIAFYVASPSPALVLRDLLGVEPDRVEPVEEAVYRTGTGWSPEGEAYLFPRSDQQGEPEEWFVATPGAPARPLGILGTGLSGRTFGWSPDGQQIAMYLTGDDGRELLYTVDVRQEPMSPRLLLDPGAGSSVSGYAWSGDSSLLVAASSGTLWSVPVESGAGAEAFAQGGQWQLGDGGKILAYIADQELWVHTLSTGRISAATPLASAVRNLHASESSNSLLYQLMAEPGRLYHVRASGGPATPLHDPESQHAEHRDPPISPDGRIALLDLDLGDSGRELRAVDLAPGAKSKLSIPVARNNPFDLVEWGDSSRFSFAYVVDGWVSLYLASLEDGSVSRVYDSPSNLRTIQWTGWQP